MGWAEKFSSFFSYVTWYSLLNLFNLREPHFTFWTAIHLLTFFLNKSNIFVYISNFCLGLRVCLWISKSVADSLILIWNVYYIISFFTHWKFDSNMQWSFPLEKKTSPHIWYCNKNQCREIHFPLYTPNLFLFLI